ncbi:MAG: trypsin-like peptidase domain-containing protein [Coriobacteriia bacterium]|nr:trypsin-like peptidase domain-containing protein [Coriobacteriia bacterium]
MAEENKPGTDQSASSAQSAAETAASNENDAPASASTGETTRIWNPYQQQPGAAAEERAAAAETQNTTNAYSAASSAGAASQGAAQAGYQAYQQPQATGQQPYQAQGGYQAYQPYAAPGAAPSNAGQAASGAPYGAPGAQGQAGAYGTADAQGTSSWNAAGQGSGAQGAYHAQPAGNAAASSNKKKRKFKKPDLKKATKKLSTTTKTALAGFVGALLACAIFAGGSALLGHGTSNTVTLGGSGSTITASDTDASLAEQVASKASPSVVSITTYVNKQTAGGLGTKSSSSLSEYSSGSGVIISKDGYVVTNYHVIESSSKVTVSVGDKEYEAEVTGTDQSSDLAVLKIDASDLTAIEIGSSSDLKVGEWCMTVGSAFGLGQAVSSGIVSATNCTYDELNDETGSAIYANMIQTDAAANPGNSGGALVDSDGKFIGVVTMGVTYSGDNSGVNFAIPVDYVMNIAQQIIEGKTPSHAQLGVTMTTINSQLSDYYGLAVSEGAYVSSVASKSGADKAGIKEGDIIIAVDGNKASSAMDVILAIRTHNSGDTLKVTVNRDGSEQTFDVTLGSDS